MFYKNSRKEDINPEKLGYINLNLVFVTIESEFIYYKKGKLLSKLLDSAATHGVFSYHPKCKKIQLTHLSFADDLLILLKGI